jgi:hypothetical protein
MIDLPELMTPEDRKARAEVIRAEIQQEWVRFAITEAVVIWLPFAVFLVLYVTNVLPENALVPGVVVGIVASTALVLYWVFMRIQPLSRQLENRESGTTAGSG